jgi:hypothetical protein
LASRLVVWFSRIAEGVAAVSTRSQGLKSTVPPPLPPKPLSTLAVSHGAALGPVLQPHQLFSALAVPQYTERPVAPIAAVLFTIRE